MTSFFFVVINTKMSENNRFIDMWWLVVEIGWADKMLPFYLQKWPSSWILTVNIHCRENLIIGPNWACKATSLSMVWWMSIQFCVRKKWTNAIFHFHLQNGRHLGFLPLIYLVEKKLVIRLSSAWKVTSLSYVWWIYTEFCVRYWQNSKFMEKFQFKGVGVVNTSTYVSITGS